MFWKKAHRDGTLCKVADGVIALLLFLATLGAAGGVYNAHVLSSGVIFGTTSGSLSLLTFVVSLALWAKHMCCCHERYCGK